MTPLAWVIKFLPRVTEEKFVKIAATPTTIPATDRVRSKQDAGHDSSSGRQHARDGKDQDSNREEKKHSDADVQAAASAFSQEPTQRAQGLTAQAEGRGPGLRVVLKDGTGAVVRQFTGQEFLELRQAASQDFRGRGKLLDKKF